MLCLFEILILNIKEGDERERRSPLPEIIRSSCPHLGQSQESTQSECNERASS